MAARKGWDSLSEEYRKRLQAKGVTINDYSKGKPIKAARGHDKTPERPIGYSAEDYPEYSTERRDLMRQVEERKRQLWGDRPRWNEDRASRVVRQTIPPLALLRWALTASEEELLSALREDPKTYHFLGYH